MNHEQKEYRFLSKNEDTKQCNHENFIATELENFLGLKVKTMKCAECGEICKHTYQDGSDANSVFTNEDGIVCYKCNICGFIYNTNLTEEETEIYNSLLRKRCAAYL